MKALKGLFQKFSSQERQRSERRPAHGFTAYHWTDSAPKQDDIRDISSTGVYLLTEERWLPGTQVSLTLQRKGPLEKNSEHRVTLQAKAIRWGDDGVGLSFALPEDLDPHLWESLLESAGGRKEPDILGQFRMAEALAFLSRICPQASEEVKQLLRGGLGNYRVASAVEIALKAEAMLASEPHADRMRAHPRLVVPIIEVGSWAEADWTTHLWAGLLATSCTEDGNDQSNLAFVELFSQLATTHVDIFTVSCTRAPKIVSESGISSRPVICTLEDIEQIAGSGHLLRIERDLEHLFDLGLIAKSVKTPSLLPIEQADITPSSLGLQLYARCNGHRGAPQDFYAAVRQETPGASQ